MPGTSKESEFVFQGIREFVYVAPFEFKEITPET